MEEKASLSLKTKIAAWWMIIVLSFLSLIFGATGISQLLDFIGVPKLGWSFTPSPFYKFLTEGGAVFLYLVFIISSVCLLLSKKLAWKFSVGMLSIYLLGILGIGIIRPLIEEWRYEWIEWVAFGLYLIPLILLFLDRKNFWKIAK